VPRPVSDTIWGMLDFSRDPTTADKQMQAVIFYLTTFGHIDGEFDPKEKDFVRMYIRQLVEHRVKTGAASLSLAAQKELTDKFTAHFHQVLDATDRQVQELFGEAVAHDEDAESFVHGRLKLRCFEIFQEFDRAGQEQLMETIEALLMADGEAHPAEIKFRAELSALLESDLEVELEEEKSATHAQVRPATTLPSGAVDHPFFAPFEQDYATDPSLVQRQIEADRQIMARAQKVLADWRAKGQGKLAGKTSLDELAGQDLFLDGHIWACPTKPGRRYELTVLGDLHGCYSCLKAAVLQSRFFDRVRQFREAPDQHPEPKLILLGDYIDRGIFSLNGVLRAALQLFITAPEHVTVLRGNHEYFIEYEGDVYGGVKPSEAIDALKERASVEVARDYLRLFDALPTALVFDRTFFVHGGPPRDRTLREHFRDLASLNHDDLRFQMMWGDPSSADVVPLALQDECTRFPYGRLQLLRFLQKIGCNSLVRGHEKILDGFRADYRETDGLLVTLFSAGGKDNNDLPPHSPYRAVTPMALTLTHQDGQAEITPWAIDYAPYNDPRRNNFFRE
jgi:hypothetical protein